jgi:hypothetical protein
LLKLENMDNVYGFLRVNNECPEPSAAVHLMNWNSLDDESASDTLYNFTVFLDGIGYWYNNIQIEYFIPVQFLKANLVNNFSD